MSDEHGFIVYYTQREDGSWLAASIAKPWFCLAADSEEEVQAKAQRALEFWCEHQDTPLPRRERALSAFEPRSVGTLVPAAACG